MVMKRLGATAQRLSTDPIRASSRTNDILMNNDDILLSTEQTEIPAGEPPVDQSEDEIIANLVAEVADAKRAADAARDQLLRAQADLQNFRRRKERETEERVAYANARLLLELLPVLDDFERAFASVPTGETEAPWVKGFELILRKLQMVIEREGVTPILGAGPFDPHLHEAISIEPSDEVASGEIIAEIRRGYRLNDRILRHSQVRVAN